MSCALTSLDLFPQYLMRLRAAIEHHARNVREIVSCVLVAVLQNKDPGTTMRVGCRRGQIGFVLWVTIRGKGYYLTYDHPLEAIALKRHRNEKIPLATFDDQTPQRRVFETFANL